MTTHHPNTNRLLSEWKRLRTRYGVDPDTPELDKLSQKANRKLARARHLKDRLAEIEIELATLRTELAGIDKTIDLVVSEAISDLLDHHVEAWSPDPILGYRIWDVGPAGFRGFRQDWTKPEMRAYCADRRTYDEVPHTDGRCHEPPCGIYAAKNLKALLLSADEHPSSRLAVGLVAMTGKVVEHEKGYRASHTSVIALGVPQAEEPFLSADPWQIDLLFRDKSVVGLLLDIDPTTKPQNVTDQTRMIREFLKAQERKRSTWTLENQNES